MMYHSMATLCVVWWEKLAATHPDDLFPSEQQAVERSVASYTACAAVRTEYHAIDTLLLAGEDLELLPVLPIERLQLQKKPAPVPAMSELPGAMSLSALADRCMSEINNYRRGEASNDQYCLEIFRRAMQEHDDAAWTVLVDRFQEFLLAAFRRHPRSEGASRLDSPENYVARAFARFWMAAVHNQQVMFTSLGAALLYLRICLNSTILDMLRSYARAREVPLPELDFAMEAAVEDQDDGSELWEVIRTMLPGERERRLAFLLYPCNLKPREIVHLCPQEFSNVDEIYRLRRNIVDRLERGADQIRWRLNGKEV
jgi:DNA-directed RNA polymerase specialized sigma24 family protein